jgi:NADH dehydrogenase
MSTLAGSDVVTVFGGSGFIGRYIVQELARRGLRVRVAVRRPAAAWFLQPLGDVSQIQIVQANLRDPDSVARAVDGAVAVINSVGILYETRRQSFDDVHVAGAATIAAAAAKAGVRQLVHISALGANPASASEYARSKARGESAVADAFAGAVILRPSVIFGAEDRFFNLFASLARISPVLPLIGGGHTRFQPVFVGDVADVAARFALDGAPGNGVWELGGPGQYDFREILSFILETTRRKALLVPVPFALARLKAWFLQMWPWPIVTVDQMRLLETDNVVSDAALAAGRTLAGAGVSEPHCIEAVVPAYLNRYRPSGQFDGSRRRLSA